MTVPWVKLELDVAAFDAPHFETYVTRCREDGIRLTTLAQLGDTPEHRRPRRTPRPPSTRGPDRVSKAARRSAAPGRTGR
ncbi:hypothetical protein [Streptomyces sp. NEAU-W12]|uniref:hypothetical protein n=1 Tax=Streptomyces sp. NEAU-W12 TaxID=2994668 RepID=UPI00224AF783|nr:hypothetical protein [Streptomyces sp. NEAU-W12]MCX2925254.1 hypothetical protein [Streptomyces sp. NEAU-W12]